MQGLDFGHIITALRKNPGAESPAQPEIGPLLRVKILQRNSLEVFDNVTLFRKKTCLRHVTLPFYGLQDHMVERNDD